MQDKINNNQSHLLLIFLSLTSFSESVHSNASPIPQTEQTAASWLHLYTQIIGVLFVLAVFSAIYFFYKNRQLKKCLQKSRQQEDRLRTLYTAIEQSPASVVIADADAHIRYVNPRFTEVTGYALHEVLGHNPRILHSGLTSPELYDVMWEKLSHGESWSGEFINRRKNGEIYWEQAHISPILDSEGEITQYVAVKLDITDRKRREQHDRVHNRVLELLSRGAALDEILLAIVESVETEYPKMMCSILLLDKEGKHLHSGAARSLPDFFNEAINGIEIGIGAGSCGTAAFTGERVIVEDIATHPYWKSYLELTTRAGLGACWSQPIYGSANKVLGTFAIYHRDCHSPEADDIRLIEASANLAAIAIERYHAAEALRQSEEKHRRLAHYDVLTGLPTRVLFSDRLKQSIRSAKRNKKNLALMFLDLDKFKPVNDSFGHAVGDLLLKEVAVRMQSCVRASDTVGRIGGDEFVILLQDVADADCAFQVAEKIRLMLNQPFELAGYRMSISCCVGIALYPDHGTDERTLTKNADIAMYRAKENGRNQVQVF